MMCGGVEKKKGEGHHDILCEQRQATSERHALTAVLSWLHFDINSGYPSDKTETSSGGKM